VGSQAPTGEIASLADIAEVVERGHELGCHTYWHAHAWETQSSLFEDSILRNRAAVRAILPGHEFRSFSYPISGPTAANKRIAGRYFDSCRGGRQRHNHRRLDLSQLNSFFIEKGGYDFSVINSMIERNRNDNGWLIFSTHDVVPEHTVYGCSPEFFRAVVQCAVAAGATILPVREVLSRLGLANDDSDVPAKAGL
jgi:peptidoglycan/xylan/chitin deacetylase (PgdA/CDA1 family)